MKKISTLLLALTFANTAASEDTFLPEPILKTDAYFGHHTLIAEKSTHTLYLYSNDNGNPKLEKKYQMATGKKAGDKLFQGDHRTPEGIYHFSDFLTHEQLLKRHGKAGEIYGVGAFVMNYPNPIDRREGKTGGGIWLHSTNDETRIEKGLDSRGCIVAHNSNLIDISKYIELNRTNVIVVHDLKFLKKENWERSKNGLMDTIEKWKSAWANEDLKEYLSHYSQKEFFDRNRGSYQQFKTYKRAVFNNPGKPTIELKNISIMKTDDYSVVTFKQVYSSNTITDIGKKTLYLKKDEFYKWKIVSETWSKAGITDAAESEEAMAFEPRMKFFETTNPYQILGDKLVKNTQTKQTEKN